MIECMYHGGCANEAVRILINYSHEILHGGEFYCEEHAFEEGREKCSCCDNTLVEFNLEIGEGEALPTYPENGLDREGCCGWHP